jgi:hypothetical protein
MDKPLHSTQNQAGPAPPQTILSLLRQKIQLTPPSSALTRRGLKTLRTPLPPFPRFWDPTVGSPQAKLGLSTVGGENLKGGMP